jgi:hypothetical protein
MSIDIMWRPTDHAHKRLDVPAPSSFIDVMAEAGFRLPCTLDDNDLDILRAMAAVFGRNADTPNPYTDLVNLIIAHDSIDLYLTA